MARSMSLPIFSWKSSDLQRSRNRNRQHHPPSISQRVPHQFKKTMTQSKNADLSNGHLLSKQWTFAATGSATASFSTNSIFISHMAETTSLTNQTLSSVSLSGIAPLLPSHSQCSPQIVRGCVDNIIRQRSSPVDKASQDNSLLSGYATTHSKIHIIQPRI